MLGFYIVGLIFRTILIYFKTKEDPEIPEETDGENNDTENVTSESENAEEEQQDEEG